MKVTLSDPPELAKVSGYGDYDPWLKKNFYFSLCSYCLILDATAQVEHYVPQSFNPDLAEDPTNLLLGCSRCNGPGGKWDYHPDHKKRRRLKSDKTGFLVIDVRADDFGKMYLIGNDGSITAREGDTEDRAKWNITLLKLDFWKDLRKDVIDLCDGCERLLKAGTHEATLEKFLPVLAKQALFLLVFDLPISKALRDRLRAQAPEGSILASALAAMST